MGTASRPTARQSRSPHQDFGSPPRPRSHHRARPARRDRREAGGEVGRLGFDFRVNGQDTEDGWEKTLRLTVVSFAEDRAEIGAAFRNFTAQDIRYSLVREDGRWLIADARSLNPERWRLTEILSRPLP